MLLIFTVSLLSKQCICSHKCSKLISGGHAGNQFLLVGGSLPQTPFRRISFCGCAPFRRFSLPPPADIFRKRRGWFTSMIANWFVDGNGIFQKSVRLAEPQPDQQSGLFKGLGIHPNKQNLRFPASPGTVVLSVCIYRRPACHIAHRHSLRPPSTKFSQRH